MYIYIYIGTSKYYIIYKNRQNSSEPVVLLFFGRSIIVNVTPRHFAIAPLHYHNRACVQHHNTGRQGPECIYIQIYTSRCTRGRVLSGIIQRANSPGCSPSPRARRHSDLYGRPPPPQRFARVTCSSGVTIDKKLLL